MAFALDEVKRRVFLIGNEVEVYCSRDFIASMGISMLYAVLCGFCSAFAGQAVTGTGKCDETLGSDFFSAADALSVSAAFDPRERFVHFHEQSLGMSVERWSLERCRGSSFEEGIVGKNRRRYLFWLNEPACDVLSPGQQQLFELSRYFLSHLRFDIEPPSEMNRSRNYRLDADRAARVSPSMIECDDAPVGRAKNWNVGYVLDVCKCVVSRCGRYRTRICSRVLLNFSTVGKIDP